MFDLRENFLSFLDGFFPLLEGAISSSISPLNKNPFPPNLFDLGQEKLSLVAYDIRVLECQPGGPTPSVPPLLLSSAIAVTLLVLIPSDYTIVALPLVVGDLPPPPRNKIRGASQHLSAFFFPFFSTTSTPPGASTRILVFFRPKLGSCPLFFQLSGFAIRRISLQTRSTLGWTWSTPPLLPSVFFVSPFARV